MFMFKALLINLAVLLGIAICMLLLPVILPLTVLGQKRYQKRLRGLAEKYVCVECGELLGTEAIQLADERWEEMSEERRRRSPNIKFRLVRNLQAICPHCGCEYRYQEAEATFIVRERNRGQELPAPSLGPDWIE
ncbi:MAG: hypothetical protein CME32_12430 [Gimesia sp.]|nr:hypothetical protein [Gimesia sp.]